MPTYKTLGQEWMLVCYLIISLLIVSALCLLPVE